MNPSNVKLSIRLKILSVVILANVLWVLLALQSCGGDGGGDPTPVEETEVQKATKLLTTGQWIVQSVTVDASDKSSVYSNLKLTLTATGFTAIGGNPVWPANGTWKFKDESAKVIDRGDGLSINLMEVTATKLVLSLTWSKTTVAGGRTESVAGQHVFTFGK